MRLVGRSCSPHSAPQDASARTARGPRAPVAGGAPSSGGTRPLTNADLGRSTFRTSPARAEKLSRTRGAGARPSERSTTHTCAGGARRAEGPKGRPARAPGPRSATRGRPAAARCARTGRAPDAEGATSPAPAPFAPQPAGRKMELPTSACTSRSTSVRHQPTTQCREECISARLARAAGATTAPPSWPAPGRGGASNCWRAGASWRGRGRIGGRELCPGL